MDTLDNKSSNREISSKILVMTVRELIEELQKYPQDMPVAVDMNIMYPPEAEYNKLQVSQRTWVDSNYPWNRPDFDYINIE